MEFTNTCFVKAGRSLSFELTLCTFKRSFLTRKSIDPLTKVKRSTPTNASTPPSHLEKSFAHFARDLNPVFAPLATRTVLLHIYLCMITYCINKLVSQNVVTQAYVLSDSTLLGKQTMFRPTTESNIGSVDVLSLRALSSRRCRAVCRVDLGSEIEETVSLVGSLEPCPALVLLVAAES